MRSQVIRIYEPWPAPVRAACYTGPDVLPEIGDWVSSLREQGRIGRDVGFRVQWRDGAPVGVLNDRTGDHELPPSWFLVYRRGGLQVLDRSSFFERYHDPSS